MKILIINQPPFNRGDESAHKALVRGLLVKIPDSEICVLYKGAEESIRQYAVLDPRVRYIEGPNYTRLASRLKDWGMYHGFTLFWHFHLFFRILKGIYKWADVVVCAPGGICMGGFQDWDHLFHLYLAKFFKKPLAYYGRSFGPFPTETPKNRKFKDRSLQMLHYFSFLAIRDYKSELLAQELGIPYVSTVDTAFLDSPKVELPYELRSLVGNKQYIVYVPNYLLWHYAYKGKVSHEQIMRFYSRIMDVLLSSYPDCSIVMLPQIFCGRVYELSDVDFFRDLAKMTNSPRIIILPDCYSSDIQQTIIGDAQALLGARYHSIVFAINQNVPFVSLSYEHKMIGLLETLGKQRCCVDITNAFESPQNEDAAIEKICNILPTIGRDMACQQKAKSIASQCMDSFVEMLNSKKNYHEREYFGVSHYTQL